MQKKIIHLNLKKIKFYNFDEILIDGTELTKFRNYFENISKWF